MSVYIIKGIWWNEKDIKNKFLVCQVVLPWHHGSYHVGAGGEVGGCAHTQPHMLHVHLQQGPHIGFFHAKWRKEKYGALGGEGREEGSFVDQNPDPVGSETFSRIPKKIIPDPDSSRSEMNLK